MTNIAVIIAIICITLVMLAGIAAWVYIARLDRQDEEIVVKALADPPPLADQPKASLSLINREALQAEVDRRADPEQATAPLPIDPKNPPKPQVYRPRNPDDPNRPYCACHGTSLVVGRTYIMWPEGEGYRVFCRREDL